MFPKPNRSKKITLSCPQCGNTQTEPSQVISSFCRDCGEHFRVVKGRAIRNPGLRVSGITEIREPEELPKEEPFVWEDPEEESAKAPDPTDESWVISAEDKSRQAKALPKPDESTPEEAEGISAGAFFGLADEDSELDQAGAATLGDQAQAKESLAEGSVAAMIQSQEPTIAGESEKMPANYQADKKRRRAADHTADLEIRCFRCYHRQHISRFAKSTQCARCSVYISLANYEIKTVKSHTLRTRGDITIGRRGGLKKCEIACHHLTVNGIIDALVDCSGDAVFRHSGTVRGNLYCRKLIIEKHCIVEFPDGVKAERAEIQGQLIGNLTCSGPVRITRSGMINGDVEAQEIDLKNDDSISGTANINPKTSTELPAKMGFNPSIIG